MKNKICSFLKREKHWLLIIVAGGLLLGAVYLFVNSPDPEKNIKIWALFILAFVLMARAIAILDEGKK